MGKENPIKWLVKSRVGRLGLTALALTTAACGVGNQPDTPTPTLTPTPATEPAKTPVATSTPKLEVQPTAIPTPEKPSFPSYGVYSGESKDERGVPNGVILVSPLPDGRLFYAFFTTRPFPCTDGRTTQRASTVHIVDTRVFGYTRGLDSFSWSVLDMESITGSLQDSGTLVGSLKIKVPGGRGIECVLTASYNAGYQDSGKDALVKNFADLYPQTGGRRLSLSQAESQIKEMARAELP